MSIDVTKETEEHLRDADARAEAADEATLKSGGDRVPADDSVKDLKAQIEELKSSEADHLVALARDKVSEAFFA